VINFELIKNIDVNNSQSWQDKIFLTFDIDWCSNEVLSYTLDILEEHNIKATFFVTHETKLLDRIRDNKYIELGIHPNFNPLLNGDFRYGRTIDGVIEYYKNIVPESVSVRSHSLTNNSIISKVFRKYGLKYECNQYIPKNSTIIVKPYNHWEDNLVNVPHFWEDDLHIIYNDTFDSNKYIKYEGIKVFDFHPIHLFLNTDELSTYENARSNFSNYTKLKKQKNTTNNGIENNFLNLIKEVQNG